MNTIRPFQILYLKKIGIVQFRYFDNKKFWYLGIYWRRGEMQFSGNKAKDKNGKTKLVGPKPYCWYKCNIAN